MSYDSRLLNQESNQSEKNESSTALVKIPDRLTVRASTDLRGLSSADTTPGYLSVARRDGRDVTGGGGGGGGERGGMGRRRRALNQRRAVSSVGAGRGQGAGSDHRIDVGRRRPASPTAGAVAAEQADSAAAAVHRYDTTGTAELRSDGERIDDPPPSVQSFVRWTMTWSHLIQCLSGRDDSSRGFASGSWLNLN